MKKKILGMAVMALLLSTFTVSARDVSCCRDTCKVARCGQSEKCDKNRGCCDKECNLFEGLTLTDSQKAQLKQLTDNCNAVCSGQMRAARTGRCGADSVCRVERRAAKRKYLEDVKAIVGPDQYVTFLENVVVNSGRPAGKAHMKECKKEKRAHHGPRRR